ncbi:hypothetical protein TG4357_02241 [Thalassovita gelatinovora]|uniref:Oxidoreductase molybdopterin binding domain protein n=1 Tax=Thalassovita gelatinovora TaxID=53501 RepID=A0A0P1FDD7_THAGE|nr:hypothetical protein [Thalassovita gelatinovora]QIZ80586.1 hypothetical protein HFZ77_08875 [Thalassovita gelatinovora]CUH66112.1 hypothetical protein TG4357_02241 [Thalassovita gelatinovora]SEQ77131.1 hypothetical protein SAMN04488043_108191 [Thalassovita gelatinovora]
MWKSLRRLLVTLLVASAAASGTPAMASEDGTYRIRLTGALARGQTGSISVKELEKLGLQEAEAYNPLEHRSEVYTGVLLQDLVTVLGTNAVQSLTTTAIDHYEIHFEKREWNKFRIMLATRVNGDYIGFEEKGPVRIVFPDFDPNQLEYQEMLPKWMWMITKIEFNK